MNIRRLLIILGALMLLGAAGCVGVDYDSRDHTGGYGYGYSTWLDNGYPYSGYYSTYPDMYGPPSPYYYGPPYYSLYPEHSGRHHHNDGDHDRDDFRGGTQSLLPRGKTCHEARC